MFAAIVMRCVVSRYSGMMAAVDVRRHGFPVRMAHKEFQHQ